MTKPQAQARSALFHTRRDEEGEARRDLEFVEQLIDERNQADKRNWQKQREEC